MQSLLHFFNAGGIFMWPILGALVVAFVIIFERWKALYKNVQEPPADFRTRVLGHIQRGDFAGAEAYARSIAPATPLTRVVELGCHLRATGAGEEELQSRMDEKLAAEIGAIDKRTGFLAMLSNVSTLLGLLGTVTGMIQSFAAVASANPADRAIMLSLGISEALNTTAFGLVAAIPALVAFSILQNRTDRLVGGLTEETSQIFHDLLFVAERGGVVTSKVAAKETKGATAPGMAPQPAGA